ncbi:MAG: anion transporter [Rhodospirillaceae bacterium]|nr:anion transporter [Rhodospirillaceae bacterium]
MTALVVGVFAATYAGMALGRVPGLKIDRTGIALLALAVLLATGATDVTGVGREIDAPTLLLLFALMILSAQFAAGGLYGLAARAITRARAGPVALLALTVAISGGLSAVLANDIVVFAMTPLLCAGLRARGLDPRPFLLALVGASNAGSAATLIGNPQNILIGQKSGLDFWEFLLVCGPPAAAGLLIVFAAVWLVWRPVLTRVDPALAGAHALAGGGTADRLQIAKGTVATLVLIALFATPVPREVGAMAVAAALLISRKLATREMLGAVDWHLLLLFMCLFAVTGTFAETGLAANGLAWLAAHGVLPDRLAVLAPLSLAMSNGIGNVPSVILLLQIWPAPPEGALYGLAVLSTLSGNLLLTGSLANIIAAERAAAAGVPLGFADFARSGVPMTLASMAVAVLWLAWGGWMD